jgi:hypothetical protein
MKLRSILISLSLLISSSVVLGQKNQSEKRFIPFLDKGSQSNVTVTVADVFGDGVPCPRVYTNSLSNTNLFTLEQQRLIEDVLAKYTKLTTNSGPPGTELTSLRRTNLLIEAMGRTVDVEKWIARFLLN